MLKKEEYQAPVLEELDSALECLAVHGLDGGASGMGEPEPEPDL